MFVDDLCEDILMITLQSHQDGDTIRNMCERVSINLLFVQINACWLVMSVHGIQMLFVSTHWPTSSLGGDTHRVCDSWSEGPGFESCVGWLLRCGHIPVVPNWFNKGLVVCITVYGCVHLKDPLESVEKSRDCLPAPGFCLSPICP